MNSRSTPPCTEFGKGRADRARDGVESGTDVCDDAQGTVTHCTLCRIPACNDARSNCNKSEFFEEWSHGQHTVLYYS